MFLVYVVFFCIDKCAILFYVLLLVSCAHRQGLHKTSPQTPSFRRFPETLVDIHGPRPQNHVWPVCARCALHPSRTLSRSLPEEMNVLQQIMLQTSEIWTPKHRLQEESHCYCILYLVDRRFAHQRFADSRESIRREIPIFEALGQIRASLRFALKFA